MNGTVSDRISITNHLRDTYRSEIRSDISRGITAFQKYLPSKYFYDARGSYLFEQICRLPEYYQTRTELSLLRTSAQSIMGNFSDGYLVELGSGANWKIRTLLDAAWRSRSPDICYVPVDVSEPALKEASKDLPGLYPGLRVLGIVADFTRQICWVPDGRKKLFLFFGSTIGNFLADERVCLLRSVAQMMGPHDRFLVGLDLVKPKDILERAYNDTRGITAEFNKNVLDVVNRELGACFNKDHFDHVAFFNTGKEQIEMHLRAKRKISVEIKNLGMNVIINEGETIHTEISAKFRRESAEEMAFRAGMQIERWVTDPQKWFALIELSLVA